MKKIALGIVLLDGLIWFGIFASQGDGELVVLGAAILCLAAVLGFIGLVAPLVAAVILAVIAALVGSIALVNSSGEPAALMFVAIAFAAPAAAAGLLIAARRRR